MTNAQTQHSFVGKLAVATKCLFTSGRSQGHSINDNCAESDHKFLGLREETFGDKTHQ